MRGGECNGGRVLAAHEIRLSPAGTAARVPMTAEEITRIVAIG